jgi:hypothetical protein
VANDILELTSAAAAISSAGAAWATYEATRTATFINFLVVIVAVASPAYAHWLYKRDQAAEEERIDLVSASAGSAGIAAVQSTFDEAMRAKHPAMNIDALRAMKRWRREFTIEASRVERYLNNWIFDPALIEPLTRTQHELEDLIKLLDDELKDFDPQQNPNAALSTVRLATFEAAERLRLHRNFLDSYSEARTASKQRKRAAVRRKLLRAKA